ncbi:PASTA domain-containing protein [Micromonospora sp. NPDC051296]|uniref:PASTA domain-containing protein n=1 Tax=Micromonospora sp. NPDC051296 TaxID=3155046 RepID=UPI00344A062C
MTDGTTDRETGRDDTGPDRVTLMVGGGIAAALLAVIGAAGGWVLAGDEKPPVTPAEATGSRSPSAQTSPPPRERPTPTTAAPSSTAPTRPTGLAVPDLVGMDFEEAREELRGLGLGWQFVFGSGNSSSVLSTNPTAGTPVRRGVTVVVTVAGSAPPNSVPDLLGMKCRDAAAELVDNGFSPRYPNGRSGTVTAQEPEGGAVRKWNDIVYISCGTPSGDESASPQ